MSRLSSWFRRVFHGYGPILADITQNVFGPLVRSFAENPTWTDEERREFAVDLVSSYIGNKYPHYEWLIDLAVEAAVKNARDYINSIKRYNAR